MQEKKSLKYVEEITRLLDSKFRIPGTNFRYGWEPIISLVPFAGDTLTFVIQSGLLLAMLRHGASGKVAAKMTVNVLVDFLIGSIPIIGTIFDFFFKANQRNLRLLKEHYHEGKHTGSAKNVIVTTLIVLLILLILIIWGVIAIFVWIADSIF